MAIHKQNVSRARSSQSQMDERLAREFNDPLNVASREKIKAMFDGDIDQIAHFVVCLMKSARQTEQEMADLNEKLNSVRVWADVFDKSAVKVTDKEKSALMFLENDPPNFAAIAFQAGLKSARSLAGIKNAKKSHAGHAKAKAFVQEEWTRYKGEYLGNKSAFTRDYVKRVLNELGVKVTEKQMREVWLRGSL